ncbi:MAG: protein kinase [Candidatus Obscuribacterales bacterium]
MNHKPDAAPTRKETTGSTLVGQVIDGREILERLGTGGMGSVFKARHLAMDRLEAIKIMHARFIADPEFLQRFRREGQSIAALKHPNIVEVYAYGVHGVVPYLAMEFLDGESLGSLSRRSGRMSPDKAVPIFLQICAALQHAHDAGIIHRDLKPDNIMLMGDRAVVVDFGLAKVCLDAQRLTLTGEVVGDPRYMSPEQTQGQKLDLKSDIYSLGCLMYEVLTGDAPFDADNNVALMYKRLQEDPPPFPERLHIPSSYEEIVMRALALHPQDRFKSADHLAEELRYALEETYVSKPLQRTVKPSLLPSPEPNLRENQIKQKILSALVNMPGGKRLPTLLCRIVVALLIPLLMFCTVVNSTSSRPSKRPWPAQFMRSTSSSQTQPLSPRAVALDLNVRAIEGQTSILAQTPADVKTLRERARTALHADLPAITIEDCGRLISMGEEDALVHILRAEAYAALSKWKSVAADARRARELEPANYYACLLQGQAALHMKEYSVARWSAESSIRSHPTPDAYILLGDVALASRERDRAASAYRDALKLHPDDSLSAYCEMRLGNFRSALASIDRSLAVQPTAKKFHCRALIVDGLGWRDEAAVAAGKAVQMRAGNADYWDTLGYMESKQGLLQQAKRHLEQALALDSGLSEAFYHRSLVYEKMKQSALAEKDAETARSLGFRMP